MAWPPHLSRTALHARCAWGSVLAIDTRGAGCSLWACYSLGSSNTFAAHITLPPSSAWWSPGTFLTRRPSSANRAHHAFVPVRTHLSFGSCHAWVAPDALGTWWSRDALLSRGTHISLGARLPLAPRVSQNPTFARMPLHSLQPLGALHTRWTVGWTQEIRTSFQAWDGSRAARFSRGPWGPRWSIWSRIPLGARDSNLTREANRSRWARRSSEARAWQARGTWEPRLALDSRDPPGARLPLGSS